MPHRTIRERLSPEQRNYQATPGIDAGFLNYRRLLAFIPEHIRRVVEGRVAGLPTDMHPHYRELNTDHEYIKAALFVAEQKGARTLTAALASGECELGDVISSTDRILGDESVYRKPRVEFRVHSNLAFSASAWLRFSTSHVRADTTRMELSRGDRLSYVGIVDEKGQDRIVVAPLVMGAPLLYPNPEGPPDFDMMWTHYEFSENFIEDINEFSRVDEVPREESGEQWKILRNVPEADIKSAICRLLREEPRADWGGEKSDHFSTSLHLSGRRVSAAFLLKGRARFSEMKAAHLGKNGDQLVRLASEPAQLLVLQHSHLVSSAVRETLRAFALRPGSSQRYCVIDGPDTYRLLKAYGFLAP